MRTLPHQTQAFDPARAVAGFRVWVLKWEEGQPRLLSPYEDFEWQEPLVEARCVTGHRPPERGTADGHACGVHGYFELGRVLRLPSGEPVNYEAEALYWASHVGLIHKAYLVAGVVVSGGRMEIHGKEGWRAAQAEIMGFLRLGAAFRDSPRINGLTPQALREFVDEGEREFAIGAAGKPLAQRFDVPIVEVRAAREFANSVGQLTNAWAAREYRIRKAMHLPPRTPARPELWNTRDRAFLDGIGVAL